MACLSCQLAHSAREAAAIQSFVPLEDLEATAYFAVAKRRAGFPGLPMYLRRAESIGRYWIIKVTLPGSDRVFQMGVANHEVELERHGKVSPLRFRFERWRLEIVDILATMTLRQHGCEMLRPS